jgi:hypothetical protein
MDHFSKVKDYLAELGFAISHEDAGEELVIINEESKGIVNLIIDCEYPIIILEQFIFEIGDSAPASALLKLLQLNREIVHGAYVIDETGTKVLFRDTLQLGSLDINELEGSINSLSLAMAEHAEYLIELSKN